MDGLRSIRLSLGIGEVEGAGGVGLVEQHLAMELAEDTALDNLLQLEPLLGL